MQYGHLASDTWFDEQREARRAPAAAAQREPPYPLSPRATALVTQLSGRVRLRSLRNQHPEVLDLLAHHWNDSHALARTFDQLLFASGPGVPTLSLEELLDLTAIRQLAAGRLPRYRRSVWDAAFDAVE
jgi:hypothetical protein